MFSYVNSVIRWSPWTLLGNMGLPSRGGGGQGINFAGRGDEVSRRKTASCKAWKKAGRAKRSS